MKAEARPQRKAGVGRASHPEAHELALGPHHDRDLERMILLTDGVFAIALTLLGLELRAPADWDGTMSGLLHAMHGSLLAFAFSFLVIAFYWVSHRRSFRSIQRCDGPLTALNFIFLAVITLLPPGMRLLMEHNSSDQATVIYLGLIAAAGVAGALTWGYASMRPGIMASRVSPRLRIAYFLIVLLIPVTMTGLGMLSSRPGWGWLWLVTLALVVVARTVRLWVMKGLEA